HLLPRYQSVGRSVSRFGGISVHLDDPEPFHRTSTDKQVAGRVCRNGACFDTSDIGMLIAIDGGPSSRAAGALGKYNLIRVRGGDGETRHVEIAIRGPSKPIRPGVRAKVRYSYSSTTSPLLGGGGGGVGPGFGANVVWVNIRAAGCSVTLPG